MYENKTFHMIGIGGISMSGIAKILLSFNAKVTGSDIAESKITKELIELGANISYGHNPEMIDNADVVIYTAAIAEDDLELVAAKKQNKKVFERAEFLGELSKEYTNCLCIAGTHGKSTTTSMVSLIFLEASKNPTIQVGAMLSQINGNTYIGSKDYLIMESCEFVDSFLHFHPTSAIVLNVDNDHLDYFKNLDNIKKSFKSFLNLLPSNGFAIVNNDDENSKTIYDETKATIVSYAIENDANYKAANIKVDDFGFYTFDIYKDNNFLVNIKLNIHGKHNIYNALAAVALSNKYIDDTEAIKKGIESYKGVGRRFEFITKYKGALVFDDYAHHPTEINATLNSVKEIKHNKSWAVFQSHTFSRTKDHLDEFADILSKFDNIVIAKIYPAREVNTFNVSESMLVDKIKVTNKNVIYIDNFDDIVSYLDEHIEKNDLVVTIGAGPINEVAYKLKENSEN